MTKAPEKKSEKRSEVVTVRPEPVAGPWRADFDRWFDRFFGDWPRLRAVPPAWPEAWQALREMELRPPALDLYEEKDRFVVKADLPGLRKEEVSVEIEENSLTIAGVRERREEVEEKNYHRSERSFGSFRRVVPLPAAIRTEGATATFRDGVLEVVLPKAETTQPKSVRVPVG